MADDLCPAASVQIDLSTDNELKNNDSPLPDSTNSDETFSKIQSWMHFCERQHDVCNLWRAASRGRQDLPTRLLRFDTHSPGVLQVKLVLGEDLAPNDDIQYATLSHCWGGQVPSRLVVEKVDDYMEQIQWNTLPKTFQEALIAAQRLGLSYLWIDALCIIQDSPTDWAKESRSMTSVYANSSLNISADAGTDSAYGLFSPRKAGVVESFLVEARAPIGGNARLLFYDDHSWAHNHFAAPLNKRAWVVQEQWLAPRVVHFAGDQVHWECQSLMTSECLPDTYDIFHVYSERNFKRLPVKSLLASTGRDFQRACEMSLLWDDLVIYYSSRELTFTSDRPVAIAGLAESFCELMGLNLDDYVHGMWRPWLHYALMWRVNTFGCLPSSRILQGSTPSWSWQSVDCRIERPARMGAPEFSPRARNTTVFETLDVHDIYREGGFAAMTGGTVRLQAHLLRATTATALGAQRNPLEEHQVGPLRPGCVLHIGDTCLLEDEAFQLVVDDTSEVGLSDFLEQEVFIMLGSFRKSEAPSIGCSGKSFDLDGDTVALGSTVGALFHAEEYQCLVLKPSLGETSFRRVAHIIFDGPWIRSHTEKIPTMEKWLYWLEDQKILDWHFRHGKIPSSLYEAVDDSMRYTINLV